MANSRFRTSLMEPMLPAQNHRELVDLAVSLVEKSARMAAQLHPRIQGKIGDLVRTMNCYYSNLIEGHNTHPRDIERALAEDYSSNPEKRDLQLEAKAHVEVQFLLDTQSTEDNVLSESRILSLHKEFYNRLPEALCWVENPDTGEKIHVLAGNYRTSDVIVGRHILPEADKIPQFMHSFEDAYNPKNLSRTEQIIAIAAAHHRLLWIHPFYDGNGRVTRLLSHAALRQAGIGNSLWSISRGLARNAQEYKSKLSMADSVREGELDGRGNLSEKRLIEFCKFFLDTALDQVEFMQRLLELPSLLDRVAMYTNTQILSKKLTKGSDIVLKETLVKGEIARSEVQAITGYSERQSRNIISALIKTGLLTSETPYGALSIGLPQHAIEFYFPLLYPSI